MSWIELLHCAWLAPCFLALFVFSELLRRYLSVPTEVTRKMVHIGTGLLTQLFPLFLGLYAVLLLCASFALILLVSKRKKLLESINGISRKSWGSLLYPVAVFGVFWAYSAFHWPLPFFQVPILVMALADPAAAFIGKNWGKHRFKVAGGTKSVEGSLAFFAVAMAVTIAILYPYLPVFELLMLATALAFCSSVAEAFSSTGWDNASIPLVCIFVLWIKYYVL